MQDCVGWQRRTPRRGILHLKTIDDATDVAFLVNEERAIAVLNLNAQDPGRCANIIQFEWGGELLRNVLNRNTVANKEHVVHK